MTAEELETHLLHLDVLLHEHGVRDTRVIHAANTLQDSLPDGMILRYDEVRNEYTIGLAS